MASLSKGATTTTTTSLSVSDNSNKQLRVLTVGDGDLTFSLALYRAYSHGISLLTVTTLLASVEELIATYSHAKVVLQELESEERVEVLFGIDATQLPPPLERRYNVVMFNHPHLGNSSLASSEARHARRHFVLLSHYFHSASSCLEQSNYNGWIHVCLCGSQPTTWNLNEAATRHGFTRSHFHNTSLSFDWLFSTTTTSPNPPIRGSAAPRKYRNGKLGSRHFLAKYGYRHQRTGGQLTNNITTDMMVGHSVNFFFCRPGCTEKDGPSLLLIHNVNNFPLDDRATYKCTICTMTFSTQDELTIHLQSPAMPDISSTKDVHVYTQDKRVFDSLYALKTYQTQQHSYRIDKESSIQDTNSVCSPDTKSSHSTTVRDQRKCEQNKGTTLNVIQGNESLDTTSFLSSPPSPVNINDSKCIAATTTVSTTIVAKNHDGSRLRWYCRQPFAFSQMSKSKKQWDTTIKEGQILVNHSIAFDSSRILWCGDVVSLAAPRFQQTKDLSKLPTDDVNHDISPTCTSRVRILQTISPNLLVAFKPVGIRSTGSFSPHTLEMQLSSPSFTNRLCRSFTKLETGCAGLCLVETSPTTTANNSNIVVSYTFTALVHGTVPEEWMIMSGKNKGGVHVQIPKEGGQRRWKHHRTPEGGDSSQHKDAGSISLQDSNHNDLSTESLLVVTTNEPFSDTTDHWMHIRCIDKFPAATKTKKKKVQRLSTLEITSSFDSGRLCNIICYTLRKLNHPVVNDRFCKQEYAALPRLIRNVLKNKLCIGCYHLHTSQDNNADIRIDVPQRLLCSYWIQQLSEQCSGYK